MTSRVTCCVAVPHIPSFPLQAREDGELAGRFAAVRAALDRADPGLLVVLWTDHLYGYFLDRLPTFAIALGDDVHGPVEEVPGLEPGPVRTDADAADRLLESLVAAGFDLMQSRETGVDHSVVVPLHFLDGRGLPVVAIQVNAHVPPLPRARRCYDLGVALHRAIGALPGDRRVAVISSGSFSIESGGPRVDAGRAWSAPRPDWAERVARGLAAGDDDALVAEATPEMLADAGTAAGELLAWLALAGCARGAGLRPSIDHRQGETFAFGVWE